LKCLDHVDASIRHSSHKSRFSVVETGRNTSIDHSTPPFVDTVVSHAIRFTQIDNAFREEVMRRLKTTSTDTGLTSLDLKNTAERMLPQFQAFRANLGTRRFEALRSIRISIPEMRKDYSNAAANIENARMVFTL
jgi:hypothetical protein